MSAGERTRLPLEVLPWALAVCRLAPDAHLPPWSTMPAAFVTVSRTADELSITIDQQLVPPNVRAERDYRAIRVRGTLPTNLVGILLAMAAPLAEQGIPMFAISTFDTDYVLVKTERLEEAVAALRAAGHDVGS